MLARGRDWWTPLATAILAAVALRLAWVGDDAYITLRTVENLCDGHGPVWNVGERVQTYTHPLWLLVLTCGRLLTGECYFATIALGAVGTVAAAFLLLRAAGGPWPALAMLAMRNYRARISYWV